MVPKIKLPNIEQQQIHAHQVFSFFPAYQPTFDLLPNAASDV